MQWIRRYLRHVSKYPEETSFITHVGGYTGFFFMNLKSVLCSSVISEIHPLYISINRPGCSMRTLSKPRLLATWCIASAAPAAVIKVIFYLIDCGLVFYGWKREPTFVSPISRIYIKCKFLIIFIQNNSARKMVGPTRRSPSTSYFLGAWWRGILLPSNI